MSLFATHITFTLPFPPMQPRGGSAAGASARGGAAARAVDDEDEEDEDEGAGAGATGGTAANGGAARGAGGRMDKEGRRQMQAEVARRAALRALRRPLGVCENGLRFLLQMQHSAATKVENRFVVVSCLARRSRAAHFALGGASAIEERAGARAAPAPARRRSAAAAAAAAAAPSPQDLGDDGEPKEMWPGMFTTAWDLESKRGAAAELRKARSQMHAVSYSWKTHLLGLLPSLALANPKQKGAKTPHHLRLSASRSHPVAPLLLLPFLRPQEKLREAALAGPVEELVPWTPQRTGPRRKPAWEVPRLADLVVQARTHRPLNGDWWLEAPRADWSTADSHDTRVCRAC